MAIIKNIVCKSYGDVSLDLGGSPVAFSLNPNSISVGDQVLDKSTLYPLQNKSTTAFSHLTDYPQRKHGGLAFSPNVALTSMRACLSFPTYQSQDMAYSEAHDIPQVRVLDRDLRLSTGTAVRFEDTSGKTHYITDVRDHYNAAAVAQYLRLMIMQGDDPTAPESVKTIDFGLSSLWALRGAAWGGVAGAMKISLLCVDAANKRVFFSAHIRNMSNLTHGLAGLMIADLSTIPVDGSLNLTNLRIMTSQPVNTQYLNRYMTTYQDYFCGFSSGGDPIFMTSIESDRASTNTTATNFRYWTTGSTLGANKDTFRGRVVFYSYSASTETCTTLADITGASNWGLGGLANYTADGYTGPSQMSGWIDSPIAGEENISYCYHLTCNRTVPALGWSPSLMRYKWDRSTDSFEAQPVTIDLTGSGETDIRNLYQHPSQYCQTDTNSALYCYATPTAIFTKDASDNYYISVLTQLGVAEFEALVQANNGGNILTFSLNKTTMSDVTYHSHSKVDAYRITPFSANGDKLGAIHASTAKMWAWSAGGFVESVSESGSFFVLTQDNSGNTWGLSASVTNLLAGGTTIGATREFTMIVHLISSDIPNSVRVAFEDSAIVYNGTPLTKNLVVNAYDTSGSRINTSVTLNLSGVVATFQSNGLKVLTLNTSDAGDTLVPLTITEAGFINVSASFAI